MPEPDDEGGGGGGDDGFSNSGEGLFDADDNRGFGRAETESVIKRRRK